MIATTKSKANPIFCASWSCGGDGFVDAPGYKRVELYKLGPNGPWELRGCPARRWHDYDPAYRGRDSAIEWIATEAIDILTGHGYTLDQAAVMVDGGDAGPGYRVDGETDDDRRERQRVDAENRWFRGLSYEHRCEWERIERAHNLATANGEPSTYDRDLTEFRRRTGAPAIDQRSN